MTPEEIENFNFRNNAKHLIQEKKFTEAIFLLRRCSLLNNEWKTLQAECILNLVGAENALDVLGQASPPYTAHYYTVASSCHEALEHYAHAAELLKSINNWHTNIHLTIKIGRLYEEAAILLPEDHSGRQRVLDLALEAYQSYPDYYNQRPILLSLAPLLFVRKEYEAALDTYLRIPMGNDERQNQGIQNQINRLNQFFIEQALDDATLFLERRDYHSALRCYESIQNDCKDTQTLRHQAYCYEALRQYLDASRAYTDIFERTRMPADNDKACVLLEQYREQVANHQRQSMFQAHRSLTQPSTQPHAGVVINGTTYYDTIHDASASSDDMANPPGLYHG
ncbi:MAG: hypothetical protein P1U32_02555 [Legionellaceae bacterium]|nr:hypothetical protein [Legionellaceae bacterium]